MSTQSNAVTAFARLLRVHAALTRDLSAQLEARHGLTISDYEVLLRLAFAPDKRLKRVELASSVVLTPSGITRLLDGLEAAGLVARESCASDRRVIYAVLTDEGAERLNAAASDHFAAIDVVIGQRLDDEETGQLAALLGRLPGVDGEESCRPA